MPLREGQFGNATTVRERSYQSWQFPTVESLLQDIRYAVRGIVRAPRFLAHRDSDAGRRNRRKYSDLQRRLRGSAQAAAFPFGRAAGVARRVLCERQPASA